MQNGEVLGCISAIFVLVIIIIIIFLSCSGASLVGEGNYEEVAGKPILLCPMSNAGNQFYLGVIHVSNMQSEYYYMYDNDGRLELSTTTNAVIIEEDTTQPYVVFYCRRSNIWPHVSGEATANFHIPSNMIRHDYSIITDSL